MLVKFFLFTAITLVYGTLPASSTTFLIIDMASSANLARGEVKGLVRSKHLRVKAQEDLTRYANQPEIADKVESLKVDLEKDLNAAETAYAEAIEKAANSDSAARRVGMVEKAKVVLERRVIDAGREYEQSLAGLEARLGETDS